jgi:hypothetical protein
MFARFQSRPLAQPTQETAEQNETPLFLKRKVFAYERNKSDKLIAMRKEREDYIDIIKLLEEELSRARYVQIALDGRLEYQKRNTEKILTERNQFEFELQFSNKARLREINEHDKTRSTLETTRESLKEAIQVNSTRDESDASVLHLEISKLKAQKLEDVETIDFLQYAFDELDELVSDPFFTPREEDIQKRAENTILQERVEILELAAVTAKKKNAKLSQSLDAQKEALRLENKRLREENSIAILRQDVFLKCEETLLATNKNLHANNELMKRTSVVDTIETKSQMVSSLEFFLQSRTLWKRLLNRLNQV